MIDYDYSFNIEGSIKSIFEDTWFILKPHIGFMTLVWAVFYIPTNIFILLRSGDMLKHLDSGNTAVIPVMVFLSLLGTIPNIALVLLVKQKNCDDYNGLVGSAFRAVPYYITTTLVMTVKMIPIVFAGIMVSLFLSFVLNTLGIAAEQQMVLIIPLIVIVTLYAMLRYASAVPFYLMTGTRNFRAARFSSLLFKMNKRTILGAFGICTFLPMAVNFVMLLAIENEVFNVLFGFIIGYYMFLSTAFYAGFLNHIRENDSEDPSDSHSDEKDTKEITGLSD